MIEIERAAPNRGAALVITRAVIARSVTVSCDDDAEARRDASEGGQAGGGHRVDVSAHRITNLREFTCGGRSLNGAGGESNSGGWESGRPRGRDTARRKA